MATFRNLQVLHVIRHGESEYNAATSYGMDFSDPQIFNPKLTEKGRKQVSVFGCSVSISCMRDAVYIKMSAALDASPASVQVNSDIVSAVASFAQAINLRAKLEKLAKLEHAVWVTSPLTRAVETFLLSCPRRHLLAPKISQLFTPADIQVRGPLLVLSSGVSAGPGRAA